MDNDEFDFDPTENEDFLKGLDEAIGITEDGSAAGSEEDIPLDEAIFAGVNAALAEQIEMEFGKEEAAEKEKEPNKFVQIFKSIPTWTKILASVILAVLLAVLLLFGTEGGKRLMYTIVVEYIFGQLPDEEPTPIPTAVPKPTDAPVNPELTPEPTVMPENPEVTPEPTEAPEPTIAIKDSDQVVNILLLGEENIYNAKRGRTDAILLVSIDKRGGDLKVVSFLRDLYVRIPGHADDKLNAAYAYGGSKLIMETIENNFKIDIDGYVKVDFAGFMDIIDELGGLRISLTAKESEYLNTTKYISKPEERNTVAGYQNMTGAQVLGYCRVRYVETANGLRDDYGRNYRHRVVLQALFDKYKEKGLIELLTTMDRCFDYVTANKEELKPLAVDCLEAIVEKKMFSIETMQMPKSGHSQSADVAINNVMQDVIVFYPDNVEILQDFLYREED